MELIGLMFRAEDLVDHRRRVSASTIHDGQPQKVQMPIMKLPTIYHVRMHIHVFTCIYIHIHIYIYIHTYTYEHREFTIAS